MAFQFMNLLNRLSNIFNKDPNSNIGQMMSAVGQQLDAVDPAQTGLANQFAISSASGSYLDDHGKDYGVPRKYGESDNAYRARIMAVAPIYTQGPTVANIEAIVANFVGGVTPIIIEYGPNRFTMGVSPMGKFILTTTDQPFAFQIQVQNPNNVAYKRADMEAAINNAKPARSSVTFVHQGGV